MNIRKRLENEADEKFQKFTAALIPNIDNVLGVRMPVLRKISKEIYSSGNFDEFLESADLKYMEENMLKGMVICRIKKTAPEILSYVKNFIPSIDNWAVCDSFCCGLKMTKNNLSLVWDFIQPYFDSEQEYEIRFAYVMLLTYYLSDEYIDKVFMLIDKFKDDGYYARMAVAWLVSICYIKYPCETEKYLQSSKLDNQTFNKSIQKICESLKTNKETKAKLRKYKR